MAILLNRSPNRTGFTAMPSGYKRWYCMYCGHENSVIQGDGLGIQYCQQCECSSNITDYSRLEWSFRRDEETQ